jgi:hypothetical protein
MEVSDLRTIKSEKRKATKNVNKKNNTLFRY